MLKKIVMTLFVIGLLIVIFAAFRIYSSHGGKAPGLSNGKLNPCPSTPNCACSEFPESHQNYIEPIKIKNLDLEEATARLQNILVEMGSGKINKNGSYVSTTFTTKVLRFVDDLEFRIDHPNNLIHIRSASRLGKSDFGVNSQRIETIRQKWQEK